MLLCAVCVAPISHAKCKYVKNEADHLKSKRVVASTMWKGMAVHLGKKDQEYYVLGYMQSIGKRAHFNANTPMVFVFEDGSQHKIVPLDPGAGRRTALGLLINNRKSETMYVADETVLEKLAGNRLEKITIHYEADGEPHEHDFPFGRGNGKKMMKFAGCMLDGSEQG